MPLRFPFLPVLQRLLQRLRSDRALPTLRRDDVGPASGPVRLSRALVRVKRFTLTGLPARQRAQALNMQLLAWAPFETTHAVAVEQGESALVLAWSAAAASAEAIPETLLTPRPEQDGWRLLEVLEGVEAQLWREGALVATRWWPELPDGQQWQDLLRAHGEGEGLQMPKVSSVDWLASPSPAHRLRVLGAAQSQLAGWERLATTAALLACLGLTSAQARSAWEAWQARATLQEKLTALEVAAAPVRRAQDDAWRQLRRNQALAEQLRAVDPLALMDHISTVLPPRGVSIKEFELQGDEVRLGLLLTDNQSQTAVIRALQGGQWLSQVEEMRGRGDPSWLVLRAKLMDKQNPAQGAAEVSAAPASAAAPGPKGGT